MLNDISTKPPLTHPQIKQGQAIKPNHIRVGEVGRWRDVIQGDDVRRFEEKGEGKEWMDRFNV